LTTLPIICYNKGSFDKRGELSPPLRSSTPAAIQGDSAPLFSKQRITMSAILSIILPFLSKLPGMLGDFFKKKQEIEQIRWETEKQLEIERQKLTAKLAEAEYRRVEATLKATGRYFKYFTFVMWFGPYMAGLVYPPLAKQIFENLALMPQWYVESVVMIMFTIWGISVSAPAVVNIFNGMHKFFKARREFKLDKERLKAKDFFDKLRQIQGYVSQEQVDEYNKHNG
jgi:hypothetical protein